MFESCGIYLTRDGLRQRSVVKFGLTCVDTKVRYGSGQASLQLATESDADL